MTGRISIKDNKYYAIINLPTSDKKYKYKWVPIGAVKDYTEARANKAFRAILQEYEAKYANHHLLSPESKNNIDILFVDWVQQYVDSRKNNLTPNVYWSYCRRVQELKNYDMFRNKKLVDVKAYDLIAFYNAKRAEGLKDASIKKVANIMHPALRNAYHLELIAKDITAQIPNFKESHKTVNYFDKNELALFLQTIKGHQNELAFKLAAFYGFRRSEIIGLKWDAIDFEQKTITIKHKVIISQRKIWTSDKLKTESSFRTLPLIPEIEKDLIKQKQRITSNRKYFENAYDNTYKEYVIVSEMGKILFPDNLTHQFKLVLRKHKLKEIRFHDLRHSCASLLLSTGVHMKQIQEWLGHADFSTTANIYSHLDYSSKIESAKNIANALQGVYADKEERTLAEKENTDFVETVHDPLKNKRKEKPIKAKENPKEQKITPKPKTNDDEFLEFLEWKRLRKKQAEDEM